MSIASLMNSRFSLVCFTYSILATSLVIVFPTIDASNSFTPINCYGCASSSTSSTSSSSDESSNNIFASNNVDDSANRNGQYVGSVMTAQVDDQVSLHGQNKYSTQYDPSSLTLLGISGSYGVTKANSSPEFKTSFHDKYSSGKYEKSIEKEKLGFQAHFGGNGGIRGPFGAPAGLPSAGFGGRPLGGGPFGGPGSVLQGNGGFPAGQGFGSVPPGSGFGGPGFPGVPGGAGQAQPGAFGSPAFGSTGNQPGGSPFAGVPGGSPTFGSTGNPPSGSPFPGVPGGSSSFGSTGNPPGGSPFAGGPGGFAGSGTGIFPGGAFPGAGLGGLSPFGGAPGSVPGSTSFGGVGPQTGNVGVPGGNVGAIGQGSTFGAGGTAGSVPSSTNLGVSGNNPNGIPQILNQQFLGTENGVGEVVQPAQTELKPEVIQGSAGSSDSFGQQQDDYASSYFYGYPPSNYQQPLPDITVAPTLAPNPTSLIPVNKPDGAPLPGPGPLPVPIAPPYGYYYIGRKAWYVPLYFCVYYIIYVGCLILKDLYRHKAHYPEKLHEAVIENSRQLNQSVQFLTDFVMTAFDKFNNFKHSK